MTMASAIRSARICVIICYRGKGGVEFTRKWRKGFHPTLDGN